MFGLSREVRSQAGAEAGQTVTIALELDRDERTVEVPPALARGLAGDAEAAAVFAKLAYTHRKEYARWVTDAKREETRERRVAQALEMIRAGKTRS